MPNTHNRLAQAIEGSGLSQAELARRLNRSRSVISEWKAGRSEPDLDTFARLCSLLGISADTLLGLPGAPEPALPSAGALAALEKATVLDDSRMALAAAIADVDVDDGSQVASFRAAARVAADRSAEQAIERLRGDARGLALQLPDPSLEVAEPGLDSYTMSPISRFVLALARKMRAAAARLDPEAK